MIVLPAAVLAILIGVALWLASRSRGPAPSDAEARHALLANGPSAAPPARSMALGARAPADAGGDRSSRKAAGQVPVRDPSPDDSHDGPVHPHPLTEQHQRIFRENQLIGALDGAMDVKDGPGLRRLLLQYRQEYPEDPSALQAGYEVIADCLEHPGPAARAAAQRYDDIERGSTLRRFVARHCLEP